MKYLIFKIADLIFLPITFLSAFWLKVLTLGGTKRAQFSERVFMMIGILPVRDHYYQPMINPRKYLRKPLNNPRSLPGINFNDDAQIKLLGQFKYNDELLSFPIESARSHDTNYYYNNPSFKSGDAEFLYSLVRLLKPGKIIEIGSGFSTLMANEAIKKNISRNPAHGTQLVCIEPFEQPWLEKTGATVMRTLVENVEIDFFKTLQKDDILFIDSSHIIRPQGDVLFEYLEILPSLNRGVYVHIHDIFSPRDYLEEWILNEHLMWNEQYLLEAFLSGNKDYEIVGALNYLIRNHHKALTDKCPVLSKQKGREPGSFWIRKK